MIMFYSIKLGGIINFLSNVIYEIIKCNVGYTENCEYEYGYGYDDEETIEVIESPKSKKFDDKYITNYSIGSGAYSTVYLVTDILTKKKFCKKLIKKGLEHIVANEIDILSKCNHFTILRLHEVYINENIIVTEHLLGKTLQRIILERKYKKLTENEILDIFYQLCISLHYLQSNNIIHRDIKPGNIIVTRDGIVKLIDFGLAFIGDTSCLGCGTTHYMAPEVVKKDIYDCSIDVWSLGVVLFEMINSAHPFQGRNETEIKTSILNNKLILYNSQYSKELIDIITHMLDKNPKSRLTIEQILNNDIMKAASNKKNNMNDKQDILKNFMECKPILTFQT